MGIAAYNRGTQLLARKIDAEARPAEFAMMDDLNALPKLPGSATPFDAIHFTPGHGGWWAECPTTGFGYWYRTLRQAVRSWNVSVHAHTGETWIAAPLSLT